MNFEIFFKFLFSFFISSAYGESIFLALQTSLIGFYVLYYQRKRTQAFTYITVYGAIFALLLSPIVPFKVLSVLQMSVIPVICISKVSLQLFFCHLQWVPSFFCNYKITKIQKKKKIPVLISHSLALSYSIFSPIDNRKNIL